MQKLQSAPLVVYSSPALTAESLWAQPQESAAPPLLLFLEWKGWSETAEGRQDIHKLFSVKS